MSGAGSGCEVFEDRLGEADTDDLDTVSGYVRTESFHGELDTGCGGCAEESFQIAEGRPGRGTGDYIFEERLEPINGRIGTEMEHQPVDVGGILGNDTVGSC